MQVRVIAGEFGGRYLDAPNGELTHPMSERVKGSLFNIIGDEIKNASVADVFSGTGALGIEALSRGAKQAVFVEKDKLASKILQTNIDNLGLSDKAKAYRIGARTWIDSQSNDLFDVILVDPPYNDLQLATVSALVRLLKINGLMVLSYPGRGDVPSVDGIVVVDNRKYGNAALAFYRKK